MPMAMTRQISPRFHRCELTCLERTGIDLELARRQHQQYLAALSGLGCDIRTLPSDPGLPDSVFIEDTALVLDELAVLCRPGAASRRAETAAVAEALTPYRAILAIRAPGTLDGGDLLRVGQTIYAGLSSRSNAEGIGQLQRLVGQHGYEVRSVVISKCLHLKSAVSLVGDGALLANPEWIDVREFEALEVITVDPAEPHAANALRVGKSVIYPTSFPRTAERMKQRGIGLVPVDVSELQKAEGAVSCCSLVFDPSPGNPAAH